MLTVMRYQPPKALSEPEKKPWMKSSVVIPNNSISSFTAIIVTCIYRYYDINYTYHGSILAILPRPQNCTILNKSKQGETLENCAKVTLWLQLQWEWGRCIMLRQMYIRKKRVRKLGHSPHMLFNTWHQGLTRVRNSYGKRGEEKIRRVSEKWIPPTPQLKSTPVLFWIEC